MEVKKMIENKKGQTPFFEFLMVYGWVILVVLVVLGALVYFNVLNPKNFMSHPVTPSVITEVALKYCEQYENMDLESYTILNDTVQINCFRIEKGTCSQVVNGTEVCTLDIKNVTLTEVYLLSLK